MAIDFLSNEWAGSIIGIMGLGLSLFGVFIYFKSRNRTKLEMEHNNKKLIVSGVERSIPNEVTVLYKGREISNLVSTDIIIWNSGNTSIRKSDIIDKDPITIEYGNEENIFSAEVIAETRSVNNVSIHHFMDTQNKATVSFDFIDPNDGFVIQILHDSLQQNPKISGTIIGMPNGITHHAKKNSFFNNDFVKIYKKYINIFLYLSLVIGILSVLFSVFMPTELLRKTFLIESSNQNLNYVIGFRLGIFLSGAIYMVLSYALLKRKKKRYPKKLIVDLPQIKDSSDSISEK